MESNDLRIFKAVALAGSITKAAQILGYVQSNVTARIQKLETELETQLFYRQHGMILTPAGEKLLTHTVQILHMLDDAKKALNDCYMEFNNLDSIIEGVIENLGVSFVPQSAIREYEERGLLKSFSIPPQYGSAKTFFIRHRDTLMTNALLKFIEMIKKETPNQSTPPVR
ncbi:LysR family transcriptional regulator [Desulfosporosinus fructosivorans]